MPDDVDALADAVAERLRQRAEAGARANPPMTIGPFTDVPAPGSPIRSDWPQSASHYITDQVVRRDVVSYQTIQSNLYLPVGAPNNDQAATPRKYVTDLLANNYLPLVGGTMTGPITLPAAEPTGAQRATPKSYVDAQDVKRVAITGDTMTGTLQVGNNPVSPDYNAGSRINPNGQLVATGGSGIVGTPSLYLNRKAGSDVNGEPFARFLRAETGIGSITIASATSVAYNTSSDPRLKTAVGDNDDAGARVQALGRLGFKGRWIADDAGGQVWDMLYATDIATVAPYAVLGEPEAVTTSGDIDPMQVNYPSLVPLLVAALSQALDRLDALEGATP